MLPRLLASSLSCLSNCHNCLSNLKITLPVLYFNSEIDASVRQFVFLGKCKELWWWYGDALRLDSILPPTPSAVSENSLGKICSFLSQIRYHRLAYTPWLYLSARVEKFSWPLTPPVSYSSSAHFPVPASVSWCWVLLRASTRLTVT